MKVHHLCGQNNKKKLKPLILGSWNVRTLLDRQDKQNDEGFRPERRTALVLRELSRYNIDIAALSETRLPDDGELEERASGYTFFWRRKPQDARRESGVGFAIRTGLVGRLMNYEIGDRILHVRIQIDKNSYATMISVYAPTMMNDVAAIESFYSELNQLLSKIPSSDKIFLLGDFNARVGRDYTTLKGVVGRHGVGNSNSNGLLLLSIAYVPPTSWLSRTLCSV